MEYSKRALVYKNADTSKGSYAILGNMYDPIKNPEGIVNLARADNELCEDLIYEKIGKPDSFKYEPWMQYYYDLFGVKSVREALAKFFQKRFKSHGEIDPKNLAITLGCQAAMDLMFFLITDPGDCVLITAPFYSTIVEDMMRLEVKLFHVLPSDENFKISSKEFEKAFQEAQSQGLKVKAAYIINPDNPTGRAWTKAELEDILEFSKRHDLHTVVNEIYALSPVKPDSSFCSVLSLPEVPQPLKTHFLWSFSKDFGLSGLRCGVIHTKLDFSSFGTLFYMESPSTVVQVAMSRMISDEEWLDETYFPANQKRMSDAYRMVVDSLKSVGAEPFHQCQGGFFVWTNFDKILESKTVEEEMKLFNVFLKHGVYVKTGSTYHCPFPGWFRIIFTYSTKETKIGLERIKKAVLSYKAELAEK